jgi:hypothetical protein
MATCDFTLLQGGKTTSSSSSLNNAMVSSGISGVDMDFIIIILIILVIMVGFKKD